MEDTDLYSYVLCSIFSCYSNFVYSKVGHTVFSHVTTISYMVNIGSGAQRQIQTYLLTKRQSVIYAASVFSCYSNSVYGQYCVCSENPRYDDFVAVKYACSETILYSNFVPLTHTFFACFHNFIDIYI